MMRSSLATAAGTSLWRSRRRLAPAAFSAALVGIAACDTSTSPDVKPTEVEVEVTGSSTVPLRLIVSNDFFETIDQLEGTRDQVFLDADTLFIESLPYDEVFPLTDIASVVVDLSNPAETPASVRLVVRVNNGEAPYDREATMSEGGSLRYVFNYRSPSFQAAGQRSLR
ncbi:MAG: hypothetical protein P8188_00875 [Gemmatimonadota bacterium]|jgi:hypothetical protein